MDQLWQCYLRDGPAMTMLSQVWTSYDNVNPGIDQLRDGPDMTILSQRWTSSGMDQLWQLSQGWTSSGMDQLWQLSQGWTSSGMDQLWQSYLKDGPAQGWTSYYNISGMDQLRDGPAMTMLSQGWTSSWMDQLWQCYLTDGPAMTMLSHVISGMDQLWQCYVLPHWKKKLLTIVAIVPPIYWHQATQSNHWLCYAKPSTWHSSHQSTSSSVTSRTKSGNNPRICPHVAQTIPVM